MCDDGRMNTPPYITRLTRPTVSSTSWTPPLQQQALPVALPGGYPIVVAQVTPPSVPQNACIGVTTQGVNLRSSPRPEGNVNFSLAAGTFVWIKGRYPFSGTATWYYGVSTADASRIGWFSDVIDETQVTGDCQIIWRTDDVSGLTPVPTFTPTPTATRDPNIPTPTPRPRSIEQEAQAFHNNARQFGLPIPFTTWPVAGANDFQNGYGPNEFARANCQTPAVPTPTAPTPTTPPDATPLPTLIPDSCQYRNTNGIHPGVDYYTIPNETNVVAVCNGIIVPGRTSTGGSASPGTGLGLTLRCFANDPNDTDYNGVPNMSNIVVVYNHIELENVQIALPGGPYQIVNEGSTIGTTVGYTTRTGAFIAAHLDLQVYIANGYQAGDGAIQLNPRLMFGVPRPVTENERPYPDGYSTWSLQGRVEGFNTIFWQNPTSEPPFIANASTFLSNFYSFDSIYIGPNCYPIEQSNALCSIPVEENDIAQLPVLAPTSTPSPSPTP
jgi:hypothetical protein